MNASIEAAERSTDLERTASSRIFLDNFALTGLAPPDQAGGVNVKDDQLGAMIGADGGG